MDKYTVSFRIDGPGLIPSEVTKKLELQPCHVEDIDNPINRKAPRSLWSYEGAEPNQEWDSLEEGILYVLGDLGPKRELIWSNFGNFKVYWWCGHFQSSLSGGPTLSPELFRKLADFGAKLSLSNYFMEDT